MNFNVRTEPEYIYNIKKGKDKIYRTNIILIGKILTLMKRGFSPLILIVGKQRVGKSFVGLWIATKILKFFHGDLEFNLETNTYYDPINIIMNMDRLNKNVLMCDEAGATLNKAEWYHKTTIALDKIVQTQGFLTNTYIFISPFAGDIAKTFRKHFDFIVYVRRRGVFVVKEVPKKYDDLTGKIHKAFRIEQVRIKMTAIDPGIWAKYEKYSKEMKDQIRNDLSSVRNIEQNTINKVFKII